jgi:hypothetical protein
MSNGGIPSTRELLRELQDQGWRVDQTKQGHYQGFAPDGRTLITFCETAEPRAMKNNLADLRRTGQFQWPPPDRRGKRNGAVVHAPEVVTPIQSVQPRQSARAPDLDALFGNLKDAKVQLRAVEAQHETVMTAVRQAEAALEEAKRRAELALSEARERARRSEEDMDAARRLVMEAKAEFDAAFEGDAA